LKKQIPFSLDYFFGIKTVTTSALEELWASECWNKLALPKNL